VVRSTQHPTSRTPYASTAFRREVREEVLVPFDRRLAGARRGEGAALRRASRRSMAFSKVRVSGLEPFGIEAFVVPSVT
jgi:hypothetical protein